MGASVEIRDRSKSTVDVRAEIDGLGKHKWLTVSDEDGESVALTPQQLVRLIKFARDEGFIE